MKINIKFVFITLIIVLFDLCAQANDTLVRIKAIRGTYSDESILRIDHRATDEFDGTYDAYKMWSNNSQHPQIWLVTPSLNEQLSLNTVPFDTSFRSFRLGFKTTIADSITFQFSAFQKIDTNIRIYLRDLTTGALINIREVTEYKFNSGIVNNANRFRMLIAGVTTYFNGALDYGVPDSLITLRVLNSIYEIDNTTMKAYNVIVEPEGFFTVNSNATLRVKNYFKIKSDASGTGSFINKGNVVISKPFIVEKYLADNTQGGWSLAPPITNADTSMLNGTDGIWIFNPLIANWQLANDPHLPDKHGFVTRFLGNDKTISFTGNLIEDDYKVNLIRTGDSTGNFGWNLIGNPYTSAIDWEYLQPSDKYQINNAIYFRRLDGGVDAFVNGAGINEGTSFIPPMQSFWVQVTIYKPDGFVIFNPDVRVHSPQQHYKKNNTGILKLKISDNIHSDETAIRFNTDATNQFDGNFDAYKLFSENPLHPQIYLFTPDNEKLAINTLPDNNTPFSVPVGIYAPNATLSIDFINANAIDDYDITLEDIYAQKLIDIKNTNAYSFSTPIGFSDNRFVLHFLPLSTHIKTAEDSNFNIYFNNKQLIIEADDLPDGTCYNIYNALGQCVKEGEIPSQAKVHKISFLDNNGVYLIQINNSEHNIRYVSKFIARF